MAALLGRELRRIVAPLTSASLLFTLLRTKKARDRWKPQQCC